MCFDLRVDTIMCLVGLVVDCTSPATHQGAEEEAAQAPGAEALTPIDRLVAASGKLQLIDSMMRRLKEGGHRVLLYSQFTRVLDVLEDWLEGRGWGYCRIDGNVGAWRCCAI